MSLTVYLSGPITGKTFENAQGWREATVAELRPYGFRVLNPLRGKSFLGHQMQGKKIVVHDPQKNPTLSDQALVNRDKLDVLNSDIVLVNFMEATERSIGTIFEIAWAEDHNKLVVVAMPQDNVHDHAFIRVPAVIFETLEEAVRYIISCGVEEVERD